MDISEAGARSGSISGRAEGGEVAPRELSSQPTSRPLWDLIGPSPVPDCPVREAQKEETGPGA